VSAVKRLATRRASSVEVSEEKGMRTLHLGGNAIQSAMSLDDPDSLALDYTQAMMAFALFVPSPRDVMVIGLGGGSLAKFVHRRMAPARVVAVEINPQVAAAARSFFDLPREDERFAVVIGDGAKYVPQHPASADVMLVDGFEDGRVVSELCTQRFYDASFDALRSVGVMVANFIAEEPRFGIYLARIEKAFAGRVLLFPAEDRVNMIVLAIKGAPTRYAIDSLKAQARAQKRRLGLPFDEIVRDLVAFNPSSAAHLKCRRPGF